MTAGREKYLYIDNFLRPIKSASNYKVDELINETTNDIFIPKNIFWIKTMLILFTAKSKPHSLNNLSHNNSRLCHGRIKK